MYLVTLAHVMSTDSASSSQKVDKRATLATIASMIKITFSAKEGKNNFGRLLDEARLSPVAIEKNGRRVAVVVSSDEYEEYITNSSNLNKRMMNMLIERLKSQVQLFETIDSIL